MQTQACHLDSGLESARLISSRHPQRPLQVSSSAEAMREAGGFDPTQKITIATDTESHGRETLLIQVAHRLDPRTIVVQVYKSDSIPELPADFDLGRFLPTARYSRFFDRVILLPIRPITRRLSPVTIVHDLLGVSDLEALTRKRGMEIVRDYNAARADLPSTAEWNDRKKRWRVPALRLSMVGHYLPADLYRVFGSEYLTELLTSPRENRRGVEVRRRKLLGFREPIPFQHSAGALVEHARTTDARLFEVRVRLRNTCLPFAPASLDSLSRTFLGVPKSDAITEAEKQDMSRTFQAKALETYGYAIVDVVHTLLIHEQMQVRDREIYSLLGFTDEEIPPMRPTLGGRVAQFLVRATKKAAAGSSRLSSVGALKQLMAGGGFGLFEREAGASRFGAQTGKVHGGLLFSRTPTKFWHEAPGECRDIDMSSCYARITEDLNIYWGRPVIFEPGSSRLTLAEAVQFVRRVANDDGWMIRVSGEITSAPNAIIPSTEDAITADNFKRRKWPGRRSVGSDTAPAEDQSDNSTSRIYSATVRSGVVTSAVWQLIGAMPKKLRNEYESLNAESVIVYPSKLVAADGEQYDRMVAKFEGADLSWAQELEINRMRVVTTETIDESYVALRLPLGQYTRTLGELRREARRVEGKGSGADLALKRQANTFYGVLGSRFHDAANFVAANVITAQARAEAFAMVQALNGHQVITDGCTYRRDQIPACTFAECLEVNPDYPIRRAEHDTGIPFIDPATIPDDDVGFTTWYREHVRRFYRVKRQAFGALLATHMLAHKLTGDTGSAAFDALATDGCANNLKANGTPDGGWRAEDITARSYGRQSKQAIATWMTQTYPADHLDALAPVTTDTDLLTHDQACQKAETALDEGLSAVYVPLGLEHRRVNNYKAIKPSAFVFRTPEQRRTVVKQIAKFESKTGSGLELLALRRSYGGRRAGSLEDLAEAIYGTIRSGEHDLLKLLNANRLADPLAAVADERKTRLEILKMTARDELLQTIDLGDVDPAAITTGRILRRTV